jgi:hypothetical protein
VILIVLEFGVWAQNAKFKATIRAVPRKTNVALPQRITLSTRFDAHLHCRELSSPTAR